jgi:hypothetical protein
MLVSTFKIMMLILEYTNVCTFKIKFVDEPYKYSKLFIELNNAIWYAIGAL